MSEVMGSIRELLYEQTMERFKEGVGPDGIPWAAKSKATIDAQFRKDGSTSTKPLYLHGFLSKNIGTNSGRDFAEVSSNFDQAAMMQFGGTRAQFPNLWGNIPARPFFGMSPDNEQDIIATVMEALERAVRD